MHDAWCVCQVLASACRTAASFRGWNESHFMILTATAAPACGRRVKRRRKEREGKLLTTRWKSITRGNVATQAHDAVASRADAS